MSIISNFPIKSNGGGGNGKDAVTIIGGAKIESPFEDGSGPYTIEFTEDDGNGGVGSIGNITGSDVSYDGTNSSIEADNVQDAIDYLATMKPSMGEATKSTIIIGTSTNGCTENDCDYLCDGTADDVEINAAIQDAIQNRCQNIYLKAGTYNLSDNVVIDDTNCMELSIFGDGASYTILNGDYQLQIQKVILYLRNIDFNAISIRTKNAYNDGSLYISECNFKPIKDYAIQFYGNVVDIRNSKFVGDSNNDGSCVFDNGTFIFVDGNVVNIESNNIYCTINPNNITAIYTDYSGGSGFTTLCIPAKVSKNSIYNCTTGIYCSGVVTENNIHDVETGIINGYCVENNVLNGITNTGISGGTKIANNVVYGVNDGIGIITICNDFTTITGNSVYYLATGIKVKSSKHISPYVTTSVINNNAICKCDVGIMLEKGQVISPTVTYDCQAEYVAVSNNNIYCDTTSIDISSAFSKTFVSQNICSKAPISDKGVGTILSGNITA